VDSPNLQLVKGFWDVLESDGLLASTDVMLEHCHEDVELSPYIGEGRVFHGTEEVREFMRRQLEEGAVVSASPWNFEEIGDDVIVSGSIRVQRRDGSIADAQLRWTYTFRDGRVAAASTSPVAA
jgi:ketosteroid isomerase-like protein